MKNLGNTDQRPRKAMHLLTFAVSSRRYPPTYNARFYVYYNFHLVILLDEELLLFSIYFQTQLLVPDDALKMTTISNISDVLGDYMLKGWVRAYANLKLLYAYHFLPGPHRSILSHFRMCCPSYAISEG